MGYGFSIFWDADRVRIVAGFDLFIELVYAGASFGLDPFSVNINSDLNGRMA